MGRGGTSSSKLVAPDSAGGTGADCPDGTDSLSCATLLHSMAEETLHPPRVSNSPGFRSRLWRYGPIVIWAAAIFVFSSSLFSGSNTSSVLRPLVLWIFPGISDAGLALVHGLVRKAGHFLEYAILAVLIARAFRGSTREFLRKHWFAVALVFVALYALSDEFHQSFVASRTASLYDCVIDTAGGFVALALIAWRTRDSKQ